jgi:hypothetical protein
MEAEHLTERWLPVKGYEGVYSVSDLGRVRRDAPNRNGKPPMCSYGYNVNGYRQIMIRKVCHYLHRLVAQAFLGDPPTPRHEVNHKNGNRTDNRVANLEWVTHSENVRHTRYVLGRYHTSLDYAEMHRLRALGWTQRRIANALGCCQSHVSEVLKPTHWWIVSRGISTLQPSRSARGPWRYFRRV